MEANEFYNEISATYDKMTHFQARLKNEAKTMKQWVNRYQLESVIDAACGTGIHAIGLAQMGIRVVGADVSDAMLEQARQNAEKQGVTISWIQTPMQQLHRQISGAFDAVMCLGNSLPHLLNELELDAAMKSFSAVSNANGRCVLQLLNYKRILENRERIIGIRRDDHTQLIRFYDFTPPLIQFNILTIQWENEKSSHRLQTTPLFPYVKAQIEYALLANNFVDIEYFGDMQFTSFDENNSPNLVVTARKA
ncbi:class I SAM-dependent methyltransferase [candidate division KSB1 bacterium]|nr:class I SAM-dependent methyltransferase [candidate division KSB1 bacterium]